MTETHNDNSLSNKVKEYLTRKLEERQINIKKMKRKRIIVKILYYSTTITSIIISTVLATICTSVAVPPIAIIILSMSSAALTAISTKFNFKDKNNQISKDIEKLHRLNERLDYVVSCNGDLTNAEYNQILSEFT